VKNENNNKIMDLKGHPIHRQTKGKWNVQKNKTKRRKTSHPLFNGTIPKYLKS
jgi:hypothetical protein